MRLADNVLVQVKINAQNAKIIWKNLMIQMEDNAYVAMRCAIIYVFQAVKKENMSTPVQAGYQFACLVTRHAHNVLARRKISVQNAKII